MNTSKLTIRDLSGGGLLLDANVDAPSHLEFDGSHSGGGVGARDGSLCLIIRELG